jgi:hypothetical protein
LVHVWISTDLEDAHFNKGQLQRRNVRFLLCAEGNMHKIKPTQIIHETKKKFHAKSASLEKATYFHWTTNLHQMLGILTHFIHKVGYPAPSVVNNDRGSMTEERGSLLRP